MKKVLIISYYWPPAGGSGVQRWLKFSKYLPNYNWKPVIFTPENPYFEVRDKELLNDIPSEAEVWKHPIWEPYALKDKLFGKGGKGQNAGIIATEKSLKSNVLNWVRGNIFVPDPKVYWVKPSIKLLKQKIAEQGIEHIITSGPPHSMHLIGLGLKKAIPEINWIADFRDPWSELDLLTEFNLSKRSKAKHKRLENEVLKNADVTLTVSETWVEDLKKLGASRVALITNGFDADDFNPTSINNESFVIGHYGLLNHLRNPKLLWKALDRMCEKSLAFSNKLSIQLAGNIDTSVIEEINSFPNLKSKLKLLGYLSHAQVLEQYNNTSVLLLLLFNSESGVGNYPGKIFEYFAAERPILAFGPANSDTQKLMSKTNSGVYHSYNDAEIESTIKLLF